MNWSQMIGRHFPQYEPTPKEVAWIMRHFHGPQIVENPTPAEVLVVLRTEVDPHRAAEIEDGFRDEGTRMGMSHKPNLVRMYRNYCLTKKVDSSIDVRHEEKNRQRQTEDMEAERDYRAMLAAVRAASPDDLASAKARVLERANWAVRFEADDPGEWSRMAVAFAAIELERGAA